MPHLTKKSVLAIGEKKKTKNRPLSCDHYSSQRKFAPLCENLHTPLDMRCACW